MLSLTAFPNRGTQWATAPRFRGIRFRVIISDRKHNDCDGSSVRVPRGRRRAGLCDRCDCQGDTQGRFIRAVAHSGGNWGVKSFIMGIDPGMAALVQRIVRNTGCEVVLSSSWRLYQYSRDEVERRVCKFADITPILHASRGYEIKVWLTLHPEIEQYAILDDAESILPEQRGNFFQTTWERGLSEDIALAVEKHLNEETINDFADRFSTR